MTIKKIKYHRVYEDVIEQIKNLILEGNLAPGDVLPTERELAQSFGISGARCVKRSGYWKEKA
ncbi:transcriptional regulator, GntR family [Paenibacillus sp. JCM 10914]|nr:GntR family transcriptional regulator [Paenibacillus sp. JCM 10914]GAE08500.1 transcriptional regulator, GntR family [Paenibacillus sp. JCM 10914]